MKRRQSSFFATSDVLPDAESSSAPFMPKALHTLSNKLLPIVAFSDLGCRRCEDPQLREYFDKIKRAAADARDLIVELRRNFQAHGKESSE